MENEVVQLKFASGDEIVCQVMEWSEDNEEDNQMIIRNALSIATYDYDNNERRYVFVPWIHFNEGSKDYLIVNTDHITAIGKPNQYLIDQYNDAVIEVNSSSELREKEHNQHKKEATEIAKKSDTSANVLLFNKPEKDTIH